MQENEDDFLQQLISGMSAPNASESWITQSSVTLPPPTLPSPRKTASKRNEIDNLLDGVDDWDWNDDLDEVSVPEAIPAQRLPEKVSMPPVEHRHVMSPYFRCVVDVVQDSKVGKREKILSVHSDNKARHQYRVILQGDWINTDVNAGDVVNVIGELDPTGTTFVISSQHNFLILHPDLLITATAISNSSQCHRRPIISSLLASTSDVTPALVWGNMLHEIMQACLTEGRWDEKWIEAKTDEIVRQGMDSLVKLNLNLDVAKAEIRKRAQGLQSFSQRFIGDSPKPDAILSDTRARQGDQALLAICGLHDTEEDIWSPRWGLKGKLDASVQVMLEEKKGLWKGKPAKTSMPFEIKTGMSKGGMEHRAQTMLYTVLMEERYGLPVDSGLLYYTQSDEVIRVTAARNELRALIQNRNNMTAHMMKRPTGKKTDIPAPASFLPPTEDDERMCKRCFAVDGCMLYKKAVEGLDDTFSEIAEIFDDKTGHLTQKQCEFFKQWESLISLEEQEMLRFRKELWTMGAEEREKSGRCFANMVMVPPSSSAPAAAGPGSSKMTRFTYTFSRKPTPSQAKPIFSSPSKSAKSTAKFPSADSSLLSGHITRGDPVTISIEPDFLALSRGYVLELEPEHVTVGVDAELNVSNLFNRYHVADGKEVMFRIDKDEMTAGIGRIRNNLAKLFYKGGDTRRLELVVDLKRPEFDHQGAPAASQAPMSNRDTASKSVLNESQQQAMAKVLSAQDYAILLGMPGTGKTTTVAEIIKELVRRGKSVLLSSYTHSAVDTILMKLLDADFEILRLGNADKIHPSVFKMTQAARPVPTSVEELERQLLSPPVVATTCLSIDHTLFSRRTFDVCIVDEASQITLPTCLGPLRFADKFVLVGDHLQLPPLVKSSRARKGGLDVSLFRRLSEAHPHAVAELAHQYRMNEDIMKVSNTLIYEDRLRCGNAEVAARTLSVKNAAGALEKLHASSAIDCKGVVCWLKDVLDPERRVMFVDTDQVPAKESRVGDLVQNETEASLVQQLVKAMVRGGVEESQVGVISLYRQQIKIMSQLLESHRGVEILTADRSQGRDKDCIIISMVRSNDSDSIGDLLKDWRRLNVSFTRARSKLVIFGSRRTLDNTKLLQDFFELMAENNWIYKLPKGANTSHDVKPQTVFKKALKRSAAEMEKENDVAVSLSQSPRKRLRIDKSAGAKANALFKGRAILKDVAMDIQPI